MNIETDDIQVGALQPRPTPYVATYIILRIDEKRAGRELLRRLIPAVANSTRSNTERAWVAVALSFQGLKVLGVPDASLQSFPIEFQQGMAARASLLGDTGESDAANWEKPFGSNDVHLAVSAIAPDAAALEAVLAPARKAYETFAGVTAIWRLDCKVLPTEREAFGFRDGISHPAVEGSGIPGSNPQEEPLKAGEFILGYPDESGGISQPPVPEALGRNGTYVVFRKLHQRVAAFRQYLKANSANAEAEEFLAAKMMGRWRSGAPLALCPTHDDPQLGADSRRNNDFLYYADDPKGLKTPPGSHVRRMNPRDSVVLGVPRLHRMIRRGTSYGPPLPEGVLEDDGAERGLAFIFVGAHIDRQFEFVQSQWVHDGVFIGAPAEADPIVGPSNGDNQHTIPQQPIRRRLSGLPRFVVTRGGEYFFAPSLRALRWLADLST